MSNTELQNDIEVIISEVKTQIEEISEMTRLVNQALADAVSCLDDLAESPSIEATQTAIDLLDVALALLKAAANGLGVPTIDTLIDTIDSIRHQIEAAGA